MQNDKKRKRNNDHHQHQQQDKNIVTRSSYCCTRKNKMENCWRSKTSISSSTTRRRCPRRYYDQYTHHYHHLNIWKTLFLFLFLFDTSSIRQSSSSSSSQYVLATQDDAQQDEQQNDVILLENNNEEEEVEEELNNNNKEKDYDDNEEEEYTLPPENDLHFSIDPLPSSVLDSSSCTCTNEKLNDYYSHCPSIQQQQQQQQQQEKNSNTITRIFYLIVLHNERTINDALYLFRSIRNENNIILIHIDTKYNITNFYNTTLYQEIIACPCNTKHIIIKSIYDSKWSSWSMNYPTLYGIQTAVLNYTNQWDIFINLSGDTIPVYTNTYISSFFAKKELQNINFITTSACETGLIPTSIDFFPKTWHKYTHYSYQPSKLNYIDINGTYIYNYTIKTYFGSQWMALRPKFCKFLIEQLNINTSLTYQYKKYLQSTKKLMTDETFIPTILMYYFPETIPPINDNDWSLNITYTNTKNSNSKTTTTTTTTTIPSYFQRMYSIRYERMDEHVPTSTGYFPTEQRYDVPKSSGISKPHVWGPYFLGIYDLQNIKDYGSLYIRKVSKLIDYNLINILPVHSPNQIPNIGWPDEVLLTDVPDWEKTLQEAYEKQKEKEKEKKRKEKEEEEANNMEEQQNQEVDQEEQNL